MWLGEAGAMVKECFEEASGAWGLLGMFEHLWVGSKMNGRFGEGLVNVQEMFVRAYGILGVCSIDVWLF